MLEGTQPFTIEKYNRSLLHENKETSQHFSSINQGMPFSLKESHVQASTRKRTLKGRNLQFGKNNRNMGS